MATPPLEKSLAGFHHQAVWRMAGIGFGRQLDGTWVYPPIGEDLAMVVLDDIRVYITRLQNRVAQYIATRPIMDLCLSEERRPGM